MSDYPLFHQNSPGRRRLRCNPDVLNNRLDNLHLRDDLNGRRWWRRSVYSDGDLFYFIDWDIVGNWNHSGLDYILNDCDGLPSPNHHVAGRSILISRHVLLVSVEVGSSIYYLLLTLDEVV